MNDTSKLNIGDNIYDIKDAVARDEKINKSEIAEPYLDGSTVYPWSVAEHDGMLFSKVFNSSIGSTFPENKSVEPVKICDIYKRITTVDTKQELQTTYIPRHTFVWVNDDDEKIRINNIGFPNIYVYTKPADGIQRASLIIHGTYDETSQIIRFGFIIARNELTGIDSINDANQLLKVEKIDGQYVVTYQYAEDKGADYIVTGMALNNGSVYKIGTSPIMYARAYAVFKNLTDDTETIMYTPCQKVTWAEWEETQS